MTTKKLKIGFFSNNYNRFFSLQPLMSLPTAWLKRMYFKSRAHPKGMLLHSKFLSALFKQKSEGPHFWFLQFGSL